VPEQADAFVPFELKPAPPPPQPELDPLPPAPPTPPGPVPSEAA